MSDNKESMYELEYPSPEVNGGGSEGPTLIVALQGYADAGHAVEAVFPSRMAVAEQMDHYVYTSPEAKHVVVNYQHEEHGLLVLGIVGEEWYHAWFPDDGLTGYVLQSDWWEGNG